MSEPEHRLPWADLGAPYRILKVRSLPGGLEEGDTIPATFATRKAAAHQAERLQAACWEDADPVRIYVSDHSGVRVYRAAGDWTQHQHDDALEERRGPARRDAHRQ